MMKRFERVEKYLNQTEALTQYGSVTQRSWELQTANETLQRKLKNTEGELSTYKALKTCLAGKEITLEVFNQKTLEQTRKTYLEEIERKAQEKFRAEATALTAAELSHLLKLSREQRPANLNHLLDEARDLQVNKVLKTPDALPQWFKRDETARIDSKVQEHVNNIFWMNVNAQVEKTKKEEWRPYLDKYMREVATPYLQSITVDKFIQEIANFTFSMPCSRCNIITSFNLTPESIVKLFRGSTLSIDCATPQCKGTFLHTTFPFSLGTLFQSLSKPPIMP